MQRIQAANPFAAAQASQAALVFMRMSTGVHGPEAPASMDPMHPRSTRFAL